MRVYTKTIQGLRVKAYRDADNWIVYAEGMATSYKYPVNKWRMAEAMETSARIAIN